MIQDAVPVIFVVVRFAVLIDQFLVVYPFSCCHCLLISWYALTMQEDVSPNDRTSSVVAVYITCAALNSSEFVSLPFRGVFLVLISIQMI